MINQREMEEEGNCTSTEERRVRATEIYLPIKRTKNIIPASNEFRRQVTMIINVLYSQLNLIVENN